MAYLTDPRRNFTWQEWCDNAERNIDRYNDAASEWNGYATHTDALRMAKGDGYTEAVPDAKALLRWIETDLGDAMVTHFDAIYDVAGGSVDVGRFLAGNPECMVSVMPTKIMRTGRVIKVAVSTNYDAGIHASTIRARGAAVMALVEAFAMLNHPCEIWAIQCATGRRSGSSGNRRFLYQIKVQESDQPMQWGRIMFALAHPAMRRQMGFAIDYDNPWIVSNSHGMAPRTFTCEEDLQMNVENAIILPPVTSNYGWDEASAVAWIKDNLKRIEENAV